ncbi:MAG: V-type ATP synthase subunit E [Gammaproteobacteria bacterium]|nr:V-type ATP synthase subunit E [Gammaproteobacteria bacterium]
MTTEQEQVKTLQLAILQRANQFAEEHVQQGTMTRNKIMQDVREKIKLMEQKELLLAKVHSDREYHRLVQASELRIQGELDRNRWGLVQSVIHNVVDELDRVHKDHQQYLSILKRLLKQGASSMGQIPMLAYINSEDLTLFSENWGTLVKEACGNKYDIELSNKACLCSGGLKLVSKSGDVMIDYTFEGIVARRERELRQLIFERLFSTVSTMETVFNG